MTLPLRLVIQEGSTESGWLYNHMHEKQLVHTAATKATQTLEGTSWKEAGGELEEGTQIEKNHYFLRLAGPGSWCTRLDFSLISSLRTGLLPHDFRVTGEPGGAVIANLLHCSFPLEPLATRVRTHPALV